MVLADTSETPSGATVWLGETTDEGFILDDGSFLDENLAPYVVGRYCQAGKPPGMEATRVYKMFPSIIGAIPTPLSADVYYPFYNPGQPHPLVILVHGGGWAVGCRWSVNADAVTLSGENLGITLNQYFIVVAIDYRKACDPADPNIVGTPLEKTCGWYYPIIDPDTGTPGAAIHDVMDAVRWVRTSYNQIPGHANWNGKIAVMGGSAGGHISTIASALATDAAQNKPDAVAGFSAKWELKDMSLPGTNDYGCDGLYSNDPQNCWIGQVGGNPPWWEGGVNRFLQCQLIVGKDQACVDNNRYRDASPIWYFNSNTGQPPQFYANGGFCDPLGSCNELVAYQELLDFEEQLRSINLANRKFCKVAFDDHGFQLLGRKCNDSPPEEQSAWQTVVNWMKLYVCDLQHPCTYP